MKLTYKHTKYAAYTGYITQAIVNNLPALLFAMFNTKFGIPLEKIGLLVSINFGVQILVDFLSVKFIDRIGYRVGVVGAHIFAVAGLLSLGILPRVMGDTYAALLIAVVLSAIGGGLTEVLISPIVESLPGDEKAGAMSLLHSFYCWGHVGVVLLSTLYFAAAGMENWFYLPIAWAVVPFFNIFFFSQVPLRVLVEEENRVPVSRLFSSRLFWILMALMVCAGASEQAMSQWTSLFAEQGLGVTKAMGDLLGPCMFAALMGLSRLLYGLFGAKLNIRKGLLFSSALCIGAYLLAVFAPHPVLSLAGCGLCGFSVGLMWPGTFPGDALVHRLDPRTKILAVVIYIVALFLAKSFVTYAIMFALLALAGDVGCGAGPGLVGWISGWLEKSMSQISALKTGIGVAICFPLLMLLGILLLRKSSRH